MANKVIIILRSNMSDALLVIVFSQILIVRNVFWHERLSIK
jgi:hypothetical protein